MPIVLQINWESLEDALAVVSYAKPQSSGKHQSEMGAGFIDGSIPESVVGETEFILNNAQAIYGKTTMIESILKKYGFHKSHSHDAHNNKWIK